jgi:NAD(P)-dependent dehydrogenase (short-subunit alcohol dehydrogenase family)
VYGVDLTDRSDVAWGVQDAFEAFGSIDVVVNNAAKVVFAPAEDQSDHDLRDQMEVSFFAAANVTHAVLPVFRSRHSGRLIQMTSINTRRPVAGVSGYSAAKWALAGYSYSLSKELAPFGVKVTLVEPGGLRTRMVQGVEPRSIRDEYAQSVGKEASRFLERLGNEPIDPVRAAQVILDLAESTNPPLRLVLGAEAVAVSEMLSDRQRASDAAWAAVGRSVDFDSAQSWQ